MIAFYSDIAKNAYGEKCYFCKQEAIYNDMAGYRIVSVCKDHFDYRTSQDYMNFIKEYRAIIVLLSMLVGVFIGMYLFL